MIVKILSIIVLTLSTLNASEYLQHINQYNTLNNKQFDENIKELSTVNNKLQEINESITNSGPKCLTHLSHGLTYVISGNNNLYNKLSEFLKNNIKLDDNKINEEILLTIQNKILFLEKYKLAVHEMYFNNNDENLSKTLNNLYNNLNTNCTILKTIEQSLTKNDKNIINNNSKQHRKNNYSVQLSNSKYFSNLLTNKLSTNINNFYNDQEKNLDLNKNNKIQEIEINFKKSPNKITNQFDNEKYSTNDNSNLLTQQDIDSESIKTSSNINKDRNNKRDNVKYRKRTVKQKSLYRNSMHTYNNNNTVTVNNDIYPIIGYLNREKNSIPVTEGKLKLNTNNIDNNDITLNNYSPNTTNTDKQTRVYQKRRIGSQTFNSPRNTSSTQLFPQNNTKKMSNYTSSLHLYNNNIHTPTMNNSFISNDRSQDSASQNKIIKKNISIKKLLEKRKSTSQNTNATLRRNQTLNNLDYKYNTNNKMNNTRIERYNWPSTNTSSDRQSITYNLDNLNKTSYGKMFPIGNNSSRNSINNQYSRRITQYERYNNFRNKPIIGRYNPSKNNMNNTITYGALMHFNDNTSRNTNNMYSSKLENREQYDVLNKSFVNHSNLDTNGQIRIIKKMRPISGTSRNMLNRSITYNSRFPTFQNNKPKQYINNQQDLNKTVI